MNPLRAFRIKPKAKFSQASRLLRDRCVGLPQDVWKLSCAFVCQTTALAGFGRNRAFPSLVSKTSCEECPVWGANTVRRSPSVTLATFSIPPASFRGGSAGGHFIGSERLLLPESPAILGRGDEGLDHLSIDEVAIELIQFRQPEVKARIVPIRWVIRVASQIAKVLHQHECAVGFCANKTGMFPDCSQHLRPRLRIC